MSALPNPPRTAGDLYRWAEMVEAEGRVPMRRYIRAWGRWYRLPRQWSKWTEREIVAAYEAGVSRLARPTTRLDRALTWLGRRLDAFRP